MVTRAASSHQNSRSNQPNAVAIEAAKATVIAIPMSSIIPGPAMTDLLDGAPEERADPP